MDILTHTLSGIAFGTAVASFANKKHNNKISIITIGGIGGALPDIDAISLWSKFNSTIAQTFKLQHTGKEIYFSKFWYSHHAFMHSLTASIFIVFIFLLLLKLIKPKTLFKKIKLPIITFIVAYNIHLLEDMPTPSSVWGGINLFFPNSTYIGGTGNIWWWNNYDIFLIVVLVIIINLFLLFFKKIKKITLAVFFIGIFAIIYQINTRKFNFNYTTYSPKRYMKYEIKSKEIQKEILGEKVYTLMLKFDNSIAINF